MMVCMANLTIRCHPCAPIPADEIDQWLSEQVSGFRAQHAQATVRFSRLRQRFPSGPTVFGWLLELELPEPGTDFLRDELEECLADMRLLGLQPTVLVPGHLPTAPAAVGRDVLAH
jgi:hypothetical protein